MRLVLIGMIAVIAASPAAFAELEGELGPWTYEVGGEAVTVISVGDSDGVDREPVLFELGVESSLERVLDNGAEIGVRLTWRGQRDHPARAGGAGCINEAGEPAVGVFSGAATGCSPEDSGPRGAIEGAYAYIDGGYGEVTVGRDLGVAARFYEGPRDVFTHARTADPLLDPSGQSFIRLRADLAGPAPKISYATPRLLGLRAGVSFTPEANARGLDWDPVRPLGGLERPQTESVWEAGLNFSRRFRESGLRVRAGVTYAEGDLAGVAPLPAFSADISAIAAGVELEWDRFSLAASALSSDNGFPDGDYESWSVGATTSGFGADWSLTVAGAEDARLRASSDSATFGAAWAVADGLRLAVGYQRNRLEMPVFEADSQGAVLEITQTY